MIYISCFKKIKCWFYHAALYTILLSSSAFAADEINDKAPNYFLCPTTHEIMINPVSTSSGIAYERSAPLVKSLVSPTFAREYEEIYQRFMNGKLIFDNGTGQRKEFEFSQFADLDGEFNLKGLTYAYDGAIYTVSDYLRIKLGIRSVQENDRKVTVWLTPKFMVDKKSNQWKALPWSSDVGIFWSYGNWDLENFDYLVTMGFTDISSQNLFKLCRCAHGDGEVSEVACYGGASVSEMLHFNLFFK